MGTLPGVPFYSACGYKKREPLRYRLTDTIEIEFVPMEKQLA
jgi:hypothetical protein